MPTAKWGDQEVNLLVAEAYRLSYLFADAPSHLTGRKTTNNTSWLSPDHFRVSLAQFQFSSTHFRFYPGIPVFPKKLAVSLETLGFPWTLLDYFWIIPGNFQIYPWNSTKIPWKLLVISGHFFPLNFPVLTIQFFFWIQTLLKYLRIILDFQKLPLKNDNGGKHECGKMVWLREKNPSELQNLLLSFLWSKTFLTDIWPFLAFLRSIWPPQAKCCCCHLSIFFLWIKVVLVDSWYKQTKIEIVFWNTIYTRADHSKDLVQKCTRYSFIIL